ncbi:MULTISPECIES: type II toxin-antitoxin system RelE family toxin [unclassified Campylobacter]|uniref:type II toxin-antitoxin system RelE family toxin n=1 Tax=unclassified Campylobacter TaxID=2593542 RepID=UPI0022E9FBFF|nr:MULTISPECIES: type II toxin-antitoxin system RelE/ParE family toxin [unclassified Campylobacter]MDA3080636.1 type II toxin-antitoxin system RelE/ParE family toxin [Campylobacter sp. CS_NA1]MDA3085159.1 type II toxin-antitoxin system RelE/ParE family toxin [Campylobacter sp. CS_ED1]MDA3089936.1 type II toxin-antitoxin system RelE/ParE family toxin [Campylobacter sp. CS_ED2]
MKWQISIHKDVFKDLQKIDKIDAKFILDSLKEFSENYSDEFEKNLLATNKIKKLKSKENLYRIRLRKFRAIYKKDGENLEILVVRVRHRKEVYKNL